MSAKESKGMIYAWLKEPKKQPVKKWIPNQLEFMQMFVEGDIETLTVTAGAVIICNEEGKIKNLPYNCTVLEEQLFGNILLVGTDEDEFDDVPYDEDLLKTMFPGFWEE